MKSKLFITGVMLAGCVALAQMPSAQPDPTQAKPAAKAEKKAAPEVAKPKGKRDPFISPVVAARTGAAGPSCTTGKRCLMIGSVVIKGVVRGPDGMIAVVATPDKKGYFLRENDPVFNGYVYKITADSVIFRENAMDALGRSTQREVVKRIAGGGAPAV